MPSTISNNRPAEEEDDDKPGMSWERRLSTWLFYDLTGWTNIVDQSMPKKFVACLAPHTSNWDFFYGMLYSWAEGYTCHFLMKKEWFFWPVGVFMRHIGGIPVDRDKHTNLTDQLAAIAEESTYFRLCITPEGTRSANPDWKLGFYYIALKARLPILLFGLDYAKKAVICTKTIIPNGDAEGQLREIKLYYKDFKGKHPENFDIGDV